MKHFIVYQGETPDYTAGLIREDGMLLATHVCSHPCYMYRDLYGDRPERKEKFGVLDIDPIIYSAMNFKEAHPEIFALTFSDHHGRN